MSIDWIIDLLPVDPKIKQTFRQRRWEILAQGQATEIDPKNGNEVKGNGAANTRNPILVVDDRDKVVKMWRSLQLPCFQVNEGSF